MSEVASAKRRGLTEQGLKMLLATGREDCLQRDIERGKQPVQPARKTRLASAESFVPEIKNEKCLMPMDLAG